MVQKKYRSKNKVIANHQIRASKVRVLTEHGEMVGIVSIKEALQKARAQDKDLVLVTDQTSPPVAKIIDLAKFKYQQQQKQAASRKKARAQEVKEVRFTPFMGDNDFQSRLKKVKQFLKKGDKVRLSLFFKGRAITKKEFGYTVFDKIFEGTAQIAAVEMEPKLMGKKLIAQLTPDHKKKETT